MVIRESLCVPFVSSAWKLFLISRAMIKTSRCFAVPLIVFRP